MNFTDRLKQAVRDQDTDQVRSLLETESSAYATDVTPLVQAALLASQQNSSDASIAVLYFREIARENGVDFPLPNQDIVELLLKKLLSPSPLSSEQQEDILREVTQTLSALIKSLEQGEVQKDPRSVATYILEIPSVREAHQCALYVRSDVLPRTASPSSGGPRP